MVSVARRSPSFKPFRNVGCTECIISIWCVFEAIARNLCKLSARSTICFLKSFLRLDAMTLCKRCSVFSQHAVEMVLTRTMLYSSAAFQESRITSAACVRNAWMGKRLVDVNQGWCWCFCSSAEASVGFFEIEPWSYEKLRMVKSLIRLRLTVRSDPAEGQESLFASQLNRLCSDFLLRETEGILGVRMRIQSVVYSTSSSAVEIKRNYAATMNCLFFKQGIKIIEHHSKKVSHVLSQGQPI